MAERTRWTQKIERARYEVRLARRQYEAVDPDHRLVARELERRYEKALSEQEALGDGQLTARVLRRQVSLLELFEVHPSDQVVENGYIETSIVSHATARRTSDQAVAVLQDQARRWWDEERQKYRLVTSQFVLDEAALGDPDAAARRLAMLAGVPILLPDQRVESTADEILARSLMPPNAKLDALHVASAAVAGVEYLLTQNCTHIANAHVLPRVYELLEELGFPRLLICTPAEFLGDPDNEPKSNS